MLLGLNMNQMVIWLHLGWINLLPEPPRPWRSWLPPTFLLSHTRASQEGKIISLQSLVTCYFFLECHPLSGFCSTASNSNRTFQILPSKVAPPRDRTGFVSPEFEKKYKIMNIKIHTKINTYLEKKPQQRTKQKRRTHTPIIRKAWKRAHIFIN